MKFNENNVIVSGSRSSLTEFINYTTVFPRPIKVGNKVVLTQAMVNKPNVRYVIKWNFDLNDGVINVPANCILEFDGGSLSNGELIGNNTQIIANKVAIFDNINIGGTWNVAEITSTWFADAAENNGLKNVFALQNENIYNKIVIEEGDYPVSAYVDDKYVLNCLSNLDLFIVGNIVLQPNDINSYSILRCNNARNVTISGSGMIIGDKATHTGTTGEHGMGVNIYSSKFITIKDITIKDCWGDCIYVGSDKITKPENIVIDNVHLDNGRRQGISVVDGENISITNSRITNISGTNPQAAIDIEPNDGQSVSNIYICNIYVEDCEKGIIIFGGASYVKQSITIDNCNIKCTIYGISLMGIDTAVTVSNNRIETKYNAIACNTVDGKQDNAMLFINNMIYQTVIPEDPVYTVRPGAIWALKGNYEFTHNLIECVLPAFAIGAGTKRIIENDIKCNTLFHKYASNGVSIIGNVIEGNINIPGKKTLICRNTITGTIENSVGDGYDIDDSGSRIIDNEITSPIEGGSSFESKGYLYVTGNIFTNIKIYLHGTGVLNNNRFYYNADFNLVGMLIIGANYDFVGNVVDYKGVHGDDENVYLIRARNNMNNIVSASTIIKMVFYTGDGENSNVSGNVITLAETQPINCIIRTTNVGYVQPVYKNIGTTEQRPVFPVGENYYRGCRYFDTTLGKPIYWNTTNWIDANGTIV